MEPQQSTKIENATNRIDDPVESPTHVLEPAIINEESEQDVYVFIHGMGSSYHDLRPLIAEYANNGETCIVLRVDSETKLDTDTTVEEILAQLLEQVKDVTKRFSADGRRVFLVGFSMGATLALEVASDSKLGRSVAGVLAISAFFSPRWKLLVELALRLGQIAPTLRVKRWMQTTSWKRIDMPPLQPSAPIGILKPILEKGKTVFQVLQTIRSPVIFLHSMDDNCACYKTTVQAMRKLAPEKVHLVTLRNQNHWIQFDLHPAAMREVCDSFFEMVNTPQNPREEISMERLTQGNEEARHWAETVLRILVGFLALLGVLLTLSFQWLVEGTIPNAPLILLLFGTLVAAYVIMISVYYFYLVRVEVHLKHHVEPLFGGLSWIAFRTTELASGRLSRYFTQIAAIPMTVIPLLGAFGILGYAWIVYADYFRSSPFLVLGMVLAFLLSFGAVLAAIHLARFAQRELYGVPRSPKITLRLSEAKLRLYATANPAGTKQPRIEGSDL